MPAPTLPGSKRKSILVIFEFFMETMTDYFGGAPKSLQVVTAAMKLKDTCSLEEMLWPTYTAN